MFGCGSRRIKKNTADLSLSCESTLALLARRDVIALVNSEGEYPRKEGHLVIGFKKVSATIFWASTMTEPRLARSLTPIDFLRSIPCTRCLVARAAAVSAGWLRRDFQGRSEIARKDRTCNLRAYLGCVPIPARPQNGWSGGASKLGSDQIRDFERSATSRSEALSSARYRQHICKEERTGKAFPEAVQELEEQIADALDLPDRSERTVKSSWAGRSG